MSWRYTPHEGKQTEFFTHPARTVGYGGSAGSGKTDALIYHHSYLLALEEQRWRRGEIKQSGVWVAYFRRVMPNLRQTIDRCLRTFSSIDKDVKWNATDHVFTYSCGLKFMLGAMEKPHDYLKFYGYEFQELLYDELTEFEEEQFDQLETRLRSSDPVVRPFMNIRWGSNPVGPGLLWVRRRFVDPYREMGVPVGTTLRVQTKLADGRVIEHDQVFIQAYLKDNPSLHADGQYEATLRKSKAHIARALLGGDWYFTSGGLLSDFWREEIHVCKNHKPPPNTFRFRSGDFGINAPSSITWWYVDNDRAMTAYHHLYVKNLTADKIAARIREIELHYGDWDTENDRSMLRRSPLDAQCFKRGGTSYPTIAEEFRRNGVGWMPSIKDRFNGIAEVVRRLDQAIDLVTGKPISTGNADPVTSKPMIRWMERCEAVRRLLPVLPQDPNNPGDVPNGCEDHVLDDTMYACGSNPLKPRLHLVSADDKYDEEEEYERQFSRKRGLAQLRGM